MLGALVWSGAVAADPAVGRQETERFVRIQNAHDLAGLKAMLADGPDLLWITRGAAIWGRDAALQRFEALYRGTWKLEPDYSGFKLTELGPDAFAVYLPIIFTIGAPGADAVPTRFLMNLVLVRQPDGWKVTRHPADRCGAVTGCPARRVGVKVPWPANFSRRDAARCCLRHHRIGEELAG